MTTQNSIAAPLASALSARGYDTLTPVQEAMLDPDLRGQDLLVSAQTGSGKTVAFGLAMADTLLSGAERLERAGPPLALIIAPTRELAQQVQRELQWLYKEAGGRIACCVGGMDPREERRVLERGTHIVVGTPGRLSDHIRRGGLDLDLIRAVVLDEADEMLDMGFREELEHILGEAPIDRRTLMFSATVSKPIARLAESFQNNAVRVNTVSREDQHADIEYQALTVQPSDTESAVINVLRFHDAQNAIVFVSRRDAVNRLTSRLNNRGFSVVALSGEYTQKERTNAIQAMRDGRARVCVATDVAARGLDLPGLDLVIHAELPRNKEGLLHRSGRTGRAGRKGVCALIVPVRAKRRMERLLQDAKVEATWGKAPTVAEIEAQDDARLLAHEALSDAIRDGEKPLAMALLAKYGAEQVAAAFIRVQREGRSAPEEISDVSDDFGARDRRKERGREERFPREDKRRGRGQEPDFEDGSWIVLSVGRKKNADPKWILPMLCKAGGISRNQIGNIRIGPSLTHVELKPEAADAIIAKGGPEGRIDKSLSVNRASGPPSDEGFDDRPARKPFKRKGSGRPPVKGKPRFAKAAGKTPVRNDAEPKRKKPRWASDDPHRAKTKGKSKDQGKPTVSPTKGAKKPRKPRAAADTGGARIVKKKPKSSAE
ncbi:MAG: DEAD/DEAH box helicase [Pseudomonadota bacterium]